MRDLFHDKKTILALRALIPAFPCPRSCSDCCGPVPFSKWEWSQIKDKRTTSALHCPYASPTGCEIYSDRPILCRLFGVAPGLLCPNGHRPTPLFSQSQTDAIMRRYTALNPDLIAFTLPAPMAILKEASHHAR